jgi:hypothetical protein
MMDASLKAKWTAALRSGEYEQGKGFLRMEGSFCCIGVLGDIQGMDFDSRGYDNASCELGDKYAAGLSFYDRDTLARMNDGDSRFNNKKFTFDEIADFIDANH